jgi:ferredoxin-NADP reductase
MLMERLARPRVPDMAVVYSARSADEFGFAAELDSMARAGRIKLFLTVSRDGGSWAGRRGRIDESLLQEALPSPETCCLLCGPPQLVTDVTQQLVRLGVSLARILTEKY